VKEAVTKEGARKSEADVSPKLATVLAQGITLPGVIRESTVEMMVMQTVLTAGTPVQGMVEPAQAPGPVQYTAAPRRARNPERHRAGRRS